MNSFNKNIRGHFRATLSEDFITINIRYHLFDDMGQHCIFDVDFQIESVFDRVEDIFHCFGFDILRLYVRTKRKCEGSLVVSEHVKSFLEGLSNYRYMSKDFLTDDHYQELIDNVVYVYNREMKEARESKEMLEQKLFDS